LENRFFFYYTEKPKKNCGDKFEQLGMRGVELIVRKLAKRKMEKKRRISSHSETKFKHYSGNKISKRNQFVEMLREKKYFLYIPINRIYLIRK